VLFIFFSILALGLIVLLTWRSSPLDRPLHAALGAVAAGDVGNLYDRVFCGGAVRDFIDVRIASFRWPTFNIADALICAGCLYLAWRFATDGPHPVEEMQAAQPADTDLPPDESQRPQPQDTAP
jgi:lipoprotein signal peptidase